MAERQCRNCNQPAGVGVYGQRCADEIMAKALNPPFGGSQEESAPPRAGDICSPALPDRVTHHGDVRLHPHQRGTGA